ncbi:MAG: bifunctional phosphopantothenoylcysteine decarboxylase/phosphopantothenate--cysteine ligase CoaBC [Bacteroidetes bacterium]|nr:MAG: bifunctional phosphopantothenoylcysteine decarboxylase/phosphopantothenate--cysteine ligase CoaBC [Bacteroidota bacterium]
MLKGKKILIGVTGSIAAYKIPFLVRLLKKEEAEVKVLISDAGKDFVTPLTLSTLSENPVLNSFFDGSSGEWESHVELGNWADVYLVAPVTATTLGKMANGIADNLLIATYLAAKCPVFFAPAMDLDMFLHPSTAENVRRLTSFGNIEIKPKEGELASGLIGPGRMEEPEAIVKRLSAFFEKKKDFNGKKVLITAGPTYEAIDPVRFIGNHSSGKMGYAIAEVLADRGANVVLITGPVNINTSHKNIKRIDVTSANEMYEACVNEFDNTDIGILSAAVADYSPKETAKEKIKKKTGLLSIDLKPTKDILAELGRRKTERQFLVGFALETENEFANAEKKLKNKNLDFIVLNSLKEKGAGFGHDTNKITIIEENLKLSKYELKSKQEVAIDIVDKIFELHPND